jgi:hypothetical protein
MLIWLASFPRSGNTFTRMLLSHVYRFASYSLYSESIKSIEDSTRDENELMRLAGSAGQVGSLDELRARPEPVFVKTHGLPTDDAPCLYVVRDGRDALVSYAHFIQAYEPEAADGRTFEELLQMLILSRDHFGGWSGNVHAWLQRRAPLVVSRYEDLTRAPLDELERVLTQLGLSRPRLANGPPSFDELHQRWPKFFRRGASGGWLLEMPSHLHELFWQHHRAQMHTCGYQ